MFHLIHDSSSEDDDDTSIRLPTCKSGINNPFDVSSSSDDDHLFHDAYESEEQLVGPLETALLEYSDWTIHPNISEDFEISSPLRKNQSSVNSLQNLASRRLTLQRQALPPQLESPVLSKLEQNPLETTSTTPWIKLILLEELGTASSWTVLLLPYIAFLLCLVLDSYSVAQHVGPLNATSFCQNSTATPFYQTMQTPCTHSISIPADFQTPQYHKLMKHGTAFTSSPIIGVPPMSSYLRGDAVFVNLTTPIVALVAQGMVVTSTVVMQWNANRKVWAPFSVSAPEQLSMVCTMSTADTVPLSVTSSWDCTAPRIIDVLFSMPGTAVLTGDDLQVTVMYDFHKFADNQASLVYSEAGDYFRNYNINSNDNPQALVEKLVLQSNYSMEHESSGHETLSITVRFMTFVITILFMNHWCQKMSVKGFLVFSDDSCKGLNTSAMLTCWFRRTHEEEEFLNKAKKHKAMTAFWWESPWILFPERRYLLLLILTLMVVQNPLLIYAHFQPQLYNYASFHTLIDAMTGICVNFQFMLWLCIFQGLRYHTALVNRRRARQQRQVLEFRRTAKYIAKANTSFTGSEEEFIERYSQDFFETYGDVDGTGSSETLDVRLKNDPCGDSWADFLLLKCLLLFFGVANVIVCSVYRFSTNTDMGPPQRLANEITIYIYSSILVLLIKFFWVFLMLRHAIRTGKKLRTEPFLSTRPAQLAYRILLGILLLTLGSFFLPICEDLHYFVSKWRVSGHNQGVAHVASTSTFNVFLKVLIHSSQRLPYNGAAAFDGPGKILFGTVATLLAAFIFLPSRSFADPEDKWLSGNSEGKFVDSVDNISSNQYLADFGRRKYEKRLMVTLARYTHTWRIMPLPIKKVSSITSKLLSEHSFKLDSSDSSIAFFGRYTAVFCLEIACWLLEASWQAYYSPTRFSSDSFAPGRMSLDSIGLHLEKAIFDEDTLTQAYISTNMNSQVDGPEDSIIVVAFRGTANVQNMRMDLKFRQIPLLDQIIGLSDTMFQVYADGVDASYTDAWFFDSLLKESPNLKSFTPNKRIKDGCISFPAFVAKRSAVGTVSLGAKAVLKATPMVRQALPCVHQGFQEAYTRMRKEVWNSLLGILQRQLAKSVDRTRIDHEYGQKEPLCLPKIYITGHSLGGSIAQLLALDLASNCELNLQLEDPIGETYHTDDGYFHNLVDTPTRNGPNILYSPTRATSSRAYRDTRAPVKLQPPIAVYTYGQPRVGNHAFARLYKQKVPHTFRVVTEGDAITTTPTAMMCGGWYKHAGLEVMLDEGLTGNILVGPTVVETMFRFTKMRTSLMAHSLENYRDSLESGLSQAELQEYYRSHGTARTKDAKKRSQKQPIHQNLPEWLTTVKKQRPNSED